jgi:hypothetical protein
VSHPAGIYHGFRHLTLSSDEHAFYFISELSGNNKPHRLDQATFDLLVDMFTKFETVFEQHKGMLADSHRHPSRKNIVSINFLLRKFFGLLGMHEEAESFPLLKNQEKIKLYDAVFARACEDLGWKFTSSV